MAHQNITNRRQAVLAYHRAFRSPMAATSRRVVADAFGCHVSAIHGDEARLRKIGADAFQRECGR